jgi:hypothetical protein
MSKPTEPLYVVTLKHLDRDGETAAANLPEVQLNYIPGKQLAAMLGAFEVLAPTIAFPAQPEMRIAGPAGRFVVNVKAGELQLVTWSLADSAERYSAAEIFAIVSGVSTAEDVRTAAAGTEGGLGGLLEGRGSMILMAIVILALNAFTVWTLTKPKKTLVPKFEVMASEPAQRLLGEVAGIYATGTAPGSRRIEILPSGNVSRYKLGADQALISPQTFTVTPARVSGQPALITSRKSVISIKDSLSIVMFGDTYLRVAQR